ncbi:MAG: hypothetical protein GY745_18970 [Actinomycetia bacterium]|nr:hypothetical protein [Actinomycetes bacterium]
MPPLPSSPGLYIWAIDGAVAYVGQTQRSLAERLGPAGYSHITRANVQAAQPGRTNGGQQTNCRINALANATLVEGRTVEIWVRELPAEDAKRGEANWFRSHGRPPWNRA